MPLLRTTTLLLCLSCAAVGCAGSVYMPGQPGGGGSDVAGPDVREQWVAANPDTSEEIRTAILEGIFVVGMNLEHRDIVSNPRRKGTTGDGFWRSRGTGDEVRYQWFVANERQPFTDGRGRQVCELVYVDGRLEDVRYCSSAQLDSEPGAR